MDKGKALVLGSSTRAALAIVRSLGRAGIEVHLAWHDNNSPTLNSRYVSRVWDLPKPSTAEDVGWIERFIQLLDSESFDLVIPVGDPEIIPLQKHRTHFLGRKNIYLISDEAFSVLFDKRKTAELSRQQGVAVPREYEVTAVDDADVVVRELGVPVVLKPASSFVASDLEVKQHVRFASSPSQVRTLLSTMLKIGPVVAQEFFDGEGVGIELLLDSGAPVLEFMHTRIHEPQSGGGSSYRRSDIVLQELREAALAILKPLSYTGVVMVEFRYNSHTGKFVLIEVNARFWGSLPLAVASGANFPLALFELLVYGATGVRRDYRAGIFSRNILSDLKWCYDIVTNYNSEFSLVNRSPVMELFDGMLNFIKGNERWDTLTLDDPRPGFSELFSAAKVGLKKFGRVTSRSFAVQFYSSFFVRQYFHRRAREAFRDADKIVFVCKGNVCRSPFAQEYAKSKLLDGKSISSAGYFPISRRPAPPAAIEVAKQWGVNLQNHFSSVISGSSSVSNALIIVFDYENYCWVRENLDLTNVVFLGHFIGDGSVVIQDPWGKGPDEFHRVYLRIAQALDAASS